MSGPERNGIGRPTRTVGGPVSLGTDALTRRHSRTPPDVSRESGATPLTDGRSRVGDDSCCCEPVAGPVESKGRIRLDTFLTTVGLFVVFGLVGMLERGA